MEWEVKDHILMRSNHSCFSFRQVSRAPKHKLYLQLSCSECIRAPNQCCLLLRFCSLCSKGKIPLGFEFKCIFFLTLSFKDEIVFPLKVGQLLGLASCRQVMWFWSKGRSTLLNLRRVALKLNSLAYIVSSEEQIPQVLFPKKGIEYCDELNTFTNRLEAHTWF